MGRTEGEMVKIVQAREGETSFFLFFQNSLAQISDSEVFDWRGPTASPREEQQER